MQHYDGPHELWENKLAVGAALPVRPRSAAGPADGVLRLGWVGTIRCQPSLHLLAETARRMGDRLQVHVHGVVHRHVLPDFDETVAALPNLTYHGPYSYPEALPDLYGSCDIVWSQDLWQRGSNSDWLLPNRIYEASWAGCPSVAVADTETGRRIGRGRAGWTIAEPTADRLCALLATLDPETVRGRAQAMLDMPDDMFVQSGADLQRVVDRALAEAATTQRDAA